jgi:hypothetical protein
LSRDRLTQEGLPRAGGPKEHHATRGRPDTFEYVWPQHRPDNYFLDSLLSELKTRDIAPTDLRLPLHNFVLDELNHTWVQVFITFILLNFKVHCIISVIVVLFSPVVIIIVFIIPVCHMLHHRFPRVKPSRLTPATTLLASFSRGHKLSPPSKPRLPTLVIEKLISRRIILIIWIIKILLIILLVVVIILVILLILSIVIVRFIIPILSPEPLFLVLLIYLKLLCPTYKPLRRGPLILILVFREVPSYFINIYVLSIG